MPVPHTYTITSLRDYTALIEELRERSTTALWYRRCGKSAHKMVPPLYRHPRTSTATDFVALEEYK
jgi:hypothetical protein